MSALSTVSLERAHVARLPAHRLAAGLSAHSECDQVVIPRIGMMLPRQLPYDKWIRIGRQLATISSSSAWCLGDWLAYGEDAYSGRYRDAIEQTSLDYQTLRNYAWVARRFALSRRRDTLSFAHHAEVARLPEPEQDFWLRKAVELSWSRNRLRQEVRASLAERTVCDESDTVGNTGDWSVPGPSGTGMAGANSHVEETPLEVQADVDGPLIQVKLSPEQMEWCQAVAVRLGRSIEEWAATALYQAAREELRRGDG
jgi:hypothetical protein